MMKKLHFILLIFMSNFSLPSIAQEALNSEANASWKTLNQEKYTIQYPADWALDQSGQMGTQFIILSPLTSAKDHFRENVNLHIQDLQGQNLDMDRYVFLSEKQITTLMVNGHIIDSSRHQGKNREYHTLHYSGDNGVYKLQFLQYYWINDQKAYILSFTCEREQFEQYKALGEQMLNSFILL